MRHALRHLLAATLVAASGPAGGQESEPQSPPSTFFDRVEVQVVNVDVWVTDKSGTPIPDLEPSDFRLLVDGEETEITNFYAQQAGRPAGGGTVTAGEAPRSASPDSPLTLEAPGEHALHAVIFVDNANVRPANRKRVFRHLRQFLASNLGPRDAVSVVSLDSSLRIHSDFLTDHRVVARILDDLERTAAHDSTGDMARRQLLNELFEGTAMRSGESRTATTDDFRSSPQLNLIRAYAEQEYQSAKATLEVLDRFVASLAGVRGRKALVYVSDGIPNRPAEELFIAWRERYHSLRNLRITTLDAEYYRDVGHFDLLADFRELARRANAGRVTFYAIDAESDHTTALRSAALAGGVDQEALYVMEANLRDPLESTAVATGGLRLQASPRLAEELERISRDFATFYSLGFRPAHGVDGKRHRIEVKLRRGKGVIRHRESYRLKSTDEEMGEATMAALLFAAEHNPLGIHLQPGTGTVRDDGLEVLSIKVMIPMQNVVLMPMPDGGTYASQFSFYVTVKDQSGRPRPVQKIPFHLQVPAAQAEAARAETAAYDLPVVLRPGDQQVAVGVRDELAGLGATVRLALDEISG